MPKPLSSDLRQRVINYVITSYSARASALRFGVSESFAIKLVQRRREEGHIEPRHFGRPVDRGKPRHYKNTLHKVLKQEPDITLSGLCVQLSERHGTTEQTVWKWRKRDSVADKAYGSAKIRQQVAGERAVCVVPSKSNARHPIAHDKNLYAMRNIVERFFCKMKDMRRLATRFEKYATSFLAMLHIFPIRCWINRVQTLVRATRVQFLSIVVGNPKLAQTSVSNLKQIRQLNFFCDIVS